MHADLGGTGDFALGEKPSRPQRPIANGQIIDAHAIHLIGLPVGVAADDLAARGNLRTDGSTAGHSSAMAVASAAVSVATGTGRTPPLSLRAGKTKMTLDPRLWNWVRTKRPAPWPIETIVMTEAMPMTTPKTVSPERNLFLASVRNEMINRSTNSTGLPRREPDSRFRSPRPGPLPARRPAVRHTGSPSGLA